MKYLILSFNPASYKKYTGHHVIFNYISNEIAKYNGLPSNIKEKVCETFVDDLFNTVNNMTGFSKINLVKVDEATYRFGSKKLKDEYAQYGEIIKTVLL